MSRILVVDNNLIDLDALKEALSDAGYDGEIVLAVDSPEAIRRLSTGSHEALPELIICDLRLSLGSGIDVVKHVRSSAAFTHLPIVVVSSVLDEASRAACLAAGATRVAQKPRGFAEQVAMAREWLSLIGEQVAIPSGSVAGERSSARSVAAATRDTVLDLQDRLRPRLRAAASLEGAAQACTQAIYASFAPSVVLTRLFATLPFGRLPEDLRRKAWDVVERQSLHSEMSDTTPVLTLLGTAGKEPGWNDRRSSAGHAAVPLSSRSFVDSIPMVARMLQEMGIELGLRNDDAYIQKILSAGWVGSFHVEDAQTARDDLGRRIIPAHDFVETHGVRSVFGLGKAYAGDLVACLVVFANVRISRDRIESLAPLMNQFKAETSELVYGGRILGS